MFSEPVVSGESECSSDERDSGDLNGDQESIENACQLIDSKLLRWEQEDQLTSENLAMALDTYESLLKIDSENISALLGKAYVEGLTGNLQNSMRTLEYAKNVYPQNELIEGMLKEARILESELSNSGIENGELCDEIVQALNEVFERFAVNGAMGLEELRELYKVTNDEPVNPELLNLLLSGEYEVDSNGRLTRNGFLEFYHHQTVQFPEETCKDLAKLGYTLNLA